MVNNEGKKHNVSETDGTRPQGFTSNDERNLVKKFSKSFIHKIRTRRRKLAISLDDLARLVKRPLSDMLELEQGSLPFNRHLKESLLKAVGAFKT